MNPDEIEIIEDNHRWVVSPQVYADCVRLFGREWTDERCRPWSFIESEGENK